MKLELRPGLVRSRLGAALSSSFTDWKTGGLTLVTASTFFLVTLAASRPSTVVSGFSTGVSAGAAALKIRFFGLIAVSGALGVFLTGLLSFLTGVLLVNSLKGLRSSGFNFDSLAALPGVAASGCASCGVGALSLVGMGGALAAAPFHGNGIRAAAVLLITGLLIRRGDPTTCNVGKVVETG